MSQTTIQDLPFVHSFTLRGEEETFTQFWHVHPTGNFEQDRATGRAYAKELASHLAENPKDISYLWTIIEEVIADESTGIRNGFLEAAKDVFMAGAKIDREFSVIA